MSAVDARCNQRNQFIDGQSKLFLETFINQYNISYLGFCSRTQASLDFIDELLNQM
jgi:hypothetical protein